MTRRRFAHVGVRIGLTRINYMIDYDEVDRGLRPWCDWDLLDSRLLAPSYVAEGDWLVAQTSEYRH